MPRRPAGEKGADRTRPDKYAEHRSGAQTEEQRENLQASALRRFQLSLLLLGVIGSGGVAAYSLLEGWPPLEAAYMVTQIATTVGLGDLHATTPGGRAFTIVFMLAAVAAWLLLASSIVEITVSAALDRGLGRRRMQRQIEQLRDHIIVCGWGRMGQEIAEDLRQRRLPFVVVEITEPKCRAMQAAGILHVGGDASDNAVLQAAGIERARALISVAARDADNIFIVLSARALKRDLFIVARSVYDQDVEKLRLAGADRVISPYVIGARHIAAAVYDPVVVDFLDLASGPEHPDWRLEAVLVDESAPFANQTLGESEIRALCGCSVLALRERESGSFISNPEGECILRPGDTLIVLGTAEQFDRLNRVATGEKMRIRVGPPPAR